MADNSLAPPPGRVAAVDAYRGFVMFLMLAEVLRLRDVAKQIPDSGFWAFLAGQQTHVEWTGCSLHDLIQPSFSFLVGVALPFSLANRIARGQRFAVMALHALWRSALLIAIGIFLSSNGKRQTNFLVQDTLSQIGMGYFFLFLLGFARQKWQWLAFGVIVVGYWAAFAAYSPPPDLDPASVGVKADWPHFQEGFGAHWDKNTNLGAAFDRWFLNQFPRETPFVYHTGGYATLNFIPTLATMILGLIAGGWLRREWPTHVKFGAFAVLGATLLVAGYVAGAVGVCPVVKRIWTPSWVLFSGGWCFLMLAAFYAVMDWGGYQRWAFPLRVIGANSIAAYCMAHLIRGFILGTFATHFRPDVFRVFGPEYEPLMAGLAVLTVYWLVLLWMYRERIFLRI